MRKRLLLLTAFTSTLVLLVLALGLSPLFKPRVSDNLEHDLTRAFGAVEDFLQRDPSDEELSEFFMTVDNSADYRIGIISAKGGVAMGSDAQRLQTPEVAAALNGRPNTPQYNPFPFPRFFDSSGGDRIATQRIFVGEELWIMEGIVPATVIQAYQQRQWWLVGGLGALAMLVALAGATLLARRMTSPIVKAVEAAEALGNGDLQAVGPTSGPKEVIDLGVALTKLASRIERLLANERDRAASLSHRLRTPLTVLRLETDRLTNSTSGHSDEQDRMHQAIRDLEAGLDQLITEFKQSRHDGLTDKSDLVKVTKSHMDFWTPVAHAQGRTADMEAPDEPIWVPIGAKDLGVTLDALISNVFRHTPEGVGYSLSISILGGESILQLRNRASTDMSSKGPDRLGSTGMGLTIAQHTIAEAGGTMTIEADPGPDLIVTIRLGIVAGFAP